MSQTSKQAKEMLPRMFRTFLLTMPAHYHAAIELLYVEEGRLFVIADDGEHTLTEGDFAVFDGSVYHEVKSDSDSPARGFLLTVSAQLAETLGLSANRTLARHVLTDEDGRIKTALCTLYSSVTRLSLALSEEEHALLSEYVQSLCKTLLLSLYVREGTADTVQVNESRITPLILAYLEEHYTENIKLKDIAAEFGYSTTMLSYYFEKSTKRNLKHYLEEMRIARAEKMLTAVSPPTMLAVSEQCGFDSVRTFYRTFQKHMGKTPSEWRSAVREEQNADLKSGK
ncbi:MAG: AraC family transcriptional regulator [Clostridia bacterium]|nr:AraC family transcriptional regulator [Clostridia bacterium]